MLPKTPLVDGVIQEIIKRLQGSGSTINITINNFIASKLRKKPTINPDNPKSVFEAPKSVEADKFINAAKTDKASK
jgi:hypothetical protein